MTQDCERLIMPRPRHDHPTPGELEVLKVLWDSGPSTVREVMEHLNQSRPRAYTSVMSLLNVMTDKGLLKRKARGRAFVYDAKVERKGTLGHMVGDLLGRVFEGSTSALVSRLLDQSSPSEEELAEIRRVIDQYQQQDSS